MATPDSSKVRDSIINIKSSDGNPAKDWPVPPEDIEKGTNAGFISDDDIPISTITKMNGKQIDLVNIIYAFHCVKM